MSATAIHLVVTLTQQSTRQQDGLVVEYAMTANITRWVTTARSAKRSFIMIQTFPSPTLMSAEVLFVMFMHIFVTINHHHHHHHHRENF